MRSQHRNRTSRRRAEGHGEAGFQADCCQVRSLLAIRSSLASPHARATMITSRLTTKAQTTIPEPVRAALHRSPHPSVPLGAGRVECRHRSIGCHETRHRAAGSVPTGRQADRRRARCPRFRRLNSGPGRNTRRPRLGRFLRVLVGKPAGRRPGTRPSRWALTSKWSQDRISTCR